MNGLMFYEFLGNEILLKKEGFTRNEWTETRERREEFFMSQEVY